MKQYRHSMKALLGILGIGLMIQGMSSITLADPPEADIKEQFGPALQLEGKARKEINAIANIIGPGSKMVPVDATEASGEMCMLETASKHNMVHFSQNPHKPRKTWCIS